MKTTSKINEIREFLSVGQKGKVALVPTMGYLHSGHVKLIETARQYGETVVVSIFVNPLQFGPDEDLDNYPRDLARDLEICAEEGVDYVFHPDVEEMYPHDLELDISLKSMANVLDGIKRPGHFEGVVTVVNKLFNIIKPDFATFGEKDRQQLMIVEKLVEDFNHDVKVLAVETEREDDGLAKSSRNTNLTEQELAEAPSIYQSLKLGRKLINNGEKDVATIVQQMTDHINKHTSGQIDDLQILESPNLETVTSIDSDVIIFIAVQFKKARLIDNMMVRVKE